MRSAENAKDPLHRIIREAVRIRDIVDGRKHTYKVDINGQTVEKEVDINLLNSRSEYLRPNIMSGVTNIRDRM